MSQEKYAVEVQDVHKKFSYSKHKNNSIKNAITQIFKKKDHGYDEFYALNGISFNIEKGDFFGILGRNGSGKSTLLKIISEIYQPTSGSVKHDGKLVSFIELGVGFQPELTGRENVFLNGALLGFSKQEVEAMYDDIVSFAELEKFMDQKLKNYSSGMRVRLAFSVAIRAKADILILDEVLAVGDAAFRKKCNAYFETLRDSKKTVILVTHSMKDVHTYCNKAIVIDDGEIVFEGKAGNAAEEYLNLFNEKAKEQSKKQDEKLDKRVIIEDVKTIRTSEKIEIDIKLQSKVRQKDVKLAVRILDSQKKAVAGVNTQNVVKPVTINFDTSETIMVKFTIDNIFGDGDYSVDVVTGPMIVTGIYHDRINGVGRFTNSRPEGHYPVVAPASISIYNK